MNTRKKLIKEPTLGEFYEYVKTFAGKVEDNFTGVNKRLDKVERRLDGVERRVGMVETRLSGLEDTDRHVLRRLGELEEKMDEVQEVVTATGAAVDHDAECVIDYGRRIAQLEKVCA